MRQFLILDYETRSEADLKKLGAIEYARHPSTKILCAAWRLGSKQGILKAPIQMGLPDFNLPENFFIVSHNAGFEQAITKYVLGIDIPPEKWICTAAMASAHALPRSLEGACEALDLPVKKDPMGRKLILRYCKPRKPTLKDPSIWFNDAPGLKRLAEYCARDVDAETHLFLALPELNEKERKIWCLDQRINQRGVKVDRQAVTTALSMIKTETEHLKNEASNLTMGCLSSPNQRAEMLKWLEIEGVALSNLQAKTIADTLKTDLPERARALLGIRQGISKTSTAKFQAFEARSRTDGRVRDLLLYHGASTGRWSGAGVQVQNFPRGTLKNTDQAIELLKSGDVALLRLIYGPVMDTLSSCLRGMLISDSMFYCGDWASIEVRVLFWMAKHEAGLEAYRQNRDLYIEMASIIYSKKIEDVTKAEREVAKRAVLGCGYGMGFKKFGETCKAFGIEISEELARAAVDAYRSFHSPVVRLWGNLERASIAAVLNPGQKFKINRTIWFTENGFLYCELPSGRRLAYYGPEIRYEPTPWGDKRPRLYHWGVNPLSKKWELSETYGGKLTENVVQATARDIMAEAMLRAEAKNYKIAITVHDEILSQNPKGNLKEFESILAQVPEWATGCPIGVEVWSGPRYKKA